MTMTTKPQKNPHAVALGRLGGSIGGRVSSPAKRRASRANGKKGGRPAFLVCHDCGHETTSLEARLRVFNTNRCANCNGVLRRKNQARRTA